MRILLTAVAVALVPAAAWAGLGLPNELADPGFEQGGVWTKSGPVNDHISYSSLAPFGVPAAPSGGSYCGGVAGQSMAFPGGELSQIVDESQFPGWNPDFDHKIVEVDFKYFQYSLADVPMTLNVYLDYMTDLSYPDPGSPLYVKQLIASRVNMNSGGWKSSSTEVELPLQPRWLSVHFEFAYFNGTAINIIDNVDLQGLCVPEPATLSLFILGAAALIRRRR